MNWNDVKYGRYFNDAAVKQDIEYLMRDICSELSGSRFNNLIRVIKANWSGADADAFVANLEKKVQLLQTDLSKKYENRLYSIIRSNYDEFVAAQARNSDNMKF